MHNLAIGLGIVISLGLFAQTWQLQRLLRMVRNWRPDLLEDPECPRCAVVLCLRGCDPGLADNLTALLAQDYPDYHLYFVVDSPEDPAAKLAAGYLERHPDANATIRLIEPSDCASLVANHHGTLLPELARNHRLLVLVDADAVVWPGWLRTLVAPLVRTDLGMVYGNRWYMPRSLSLSTLLRFAWNFGSLQQMVALRYPWGGSLAMKSELARRPEFARLKQAFGNDTPLFGFAEQAGIGMAFHPGVILVNREQIRLRDFFPWMCRQILYSRLYHPTWPVLLGSGLLIGAVVALAVLVNTVLLWRQEWGSLAAVAGPLVLFWILWTVQLFRMDQLVGAQAIARGESFPWRGWRGTLLVFLVVPLVPLIYLSGLLWTCRMRRVRWRGVEYEVTGPWQVRVLDYQPFRAVSRNNQSIA